MAEADAPRRRRGRPPTPPELREEFVRRTISFSKTADDLVRIIADETYRTEWETYRQMVALGIAVFLSATEAEPNMTPAEVRASLNAHLRDGLRRPDHTDR